MKGILLVSLLSIGLYAAPTTCDFSKKNYEISKKKMVMAMERKAPLTMFHVEMTLNYMENILSECKLSNKETKNYEYGRKLLINYKAKVKKANKVE